MTRLFAFVLFALTFGGCTLLTGDLRVADQHDGGSDDLAIVTDLTLSPDYLGEVRDFGNPQDLKIADLAQVPDLSGEGRDDLTVVSDLATSPDLIRDAAAPSDLSDGSMPADLAAKDAAPDLFNPCKDGVKNQDETDVDCGGKTCAKCVDGKVCAAPSDCQNGGCFVPPMAAVMAIGAKAHCAASGAAPHYRVEYFATSFGDSTAVVCSLNQGKAEARIMINQFVLNAIGNMDIQPTTTSTSFRNVNGNKDVAKNVIGYVIWYDGTSAPFKVGYAMQPGLIGFSSDPAFPDNNL